MGELIRFPPKLEDKPDEDCMCIIPTDGKPVKWFKFECSFRCDGKEYAFEIWALDQADAERRMSALRETATVDGQLFGTRRL